MKPIVFKEQLKLEKNSLSQSRLSLVEYKIDYDNELGDGIFGRVYGVLERPENEKNFLSSWFPYRGMTSNGTKRYSKQSWLS